MAARHLSLLPLETDPLSLPQAGTAPGGAAPAVEHYARRVEELGGRVLERNAYDSGASISCEDDQGYRFELWQPAPGC